MENDKTKDEEEQPSTSKKESIENTSVDDMFVDSHDDDIANSEVSIQSSRTYSVISKLDLAGTGPKLPNVAIPKTDVKSHQKRKREKTKRIVGRVEKKKRPLAKRQAMRKAPKRRVKTKGEKKERNLSVSTIFTRLSSSSQTQGCEYCGHRCCRRSKMFSPLFVKTNSSPTDEIVPTIILNSEISPEMIHKALRTLTMWKQDVPTTSILDYLIRNYPVNNDKEALVFELVDKLRIAAILGIVCRTSEDTWSLTHEFQRRRVSRNHVTLFWKMYSDTLRPVAGKQKQQKPPGQNKETNTTSRTLTIYEEDIL